MPFLTDGMGRDSGKRDKARQTGYCMISSGRSLRTVVVEDGKEDREEGAGWREPLSDKHEPARDCTTTVTATIGGDINASKWV